MRLLLAVALLGFLLAGCSKDSAVVPGTDEEGRYVIRLTAENRFTPDDARVPVGATVVWVVESGGHDVNAEDGSFSSNTGRPLNATGHPQLLGPGESFQHTFTQAGTWGYWCHTHHEQDMRGVVRVG